MMKKERRKKNDILLPKILPTAITLKKYDIDKDSILKFLII